MRIRTEMVNGKRRIIITKFEPGIEKIIITKSEHRIDKTKEAYESRI
jgi:hypothetical protein